MEYIAGAIALGHSVTIEAYRGTTSLGEAVYASPVAIACMIEQGNQLVRDDAGNQVTSSSRFYANRGQAIMPPHSRVTLPDGTITTIITVQDHNSGGGWPTPDHIEVQLL